MLARLQIMVVGLALVAVFAPNVAKTYLAEGERPARQAEAQPVAATSEAAGSARLPMDPSGHFVGSFRINGRTETGLVDTGASMIAINIATAKRLGISTGTLSFSGRVETANGTVKAAVTTLDRVEIGAISVRGVDAVVLPGEALQGMLIGMSFLNRLQSYRVEDRSLRLFR